MEKIVFEIGRTETGYCGICELLPGLVVSGSDNFENFKQEIKESLAFHLKGLKEVGENYPNVFDSDYELVYKYNVQCFLHYYKNIFSFASLEVLTGINQKQLAHYAAGRSKPRSTQAEKITSALHCLAKDLLAVEIY